MEERRKADRLRTNINVRWETLTTQKRNTVYDLSSSRCFILTDDEIMPHELIRMELSLPDDWLTLWGHVVYTISEMGFAVRFVFGSGADQESINQIIRNLVAAV